MSDKNNFEITEVFVQKLATQVQNWPRDRWKYLFIGLFSLLLALYMVSSSLPHLFSNRSLLDKIQIEKKPEELSTELWLLAEVRRSVAIQEKQCQLVALSLIDCVSGIVIVAGSLFILVPLIMRWKDGGKEIQIIRLLLACHEELKSNKSNIST